MHFRPHTVVRVMDYLVIINEEKYFVHDTCPFIHRSVAQERRACEAQEQAVAQGKLASAATKKLQILGMSVPDVKHVAISGTLMSTRDVQGEVSVVYARVRASRIFAKRGVCALRMRQRTRPKGSLFRNWKVNLPYLLPPPLL